MGPMLDAGDVIVDTGCRTAVAGELWHEQHQKKLQELGLSFETAIQDEVFKFGAGPPVHSDTAHIYPVVTHGRLSWVRISVVGGAATGCPGLIGPSEMSRWEVQLHFAPKAMSVFGVSRPMRLSNTRHPVLQLLEIEPGIGRTMDEWYKPDLEELVRTLRDRPTHMAFYEQPDYDQPALAAPAAENEESEMREKSGEEDQEMASAGEEVAELPEAPDAPEWSVQALAKTQQKLEHEAEMSYSLLQNAWKDEEAESGSSTGSISDAISETSHELGAPTDSQDGSSSSEDDMTERHGSLFTAAPEPFTKGQRRRITNAVNQVLMAHDYEKQVKLEQKMASKIKTPRIPRMMRNVGFKILELFTWSCLLSRMAYTGGWQFCEPVTLPHWDITNPNDFQMALEYVNREDPDLVVIAWPCTKWSPYQRLNARTSVQKEALEELRKEQRATFLSLSAQVAASQRRRRKAVIGENPAPSLAWQQPEIILGFDGLSHVQCDQCQYNLKHPETGQPIRKRTQFAGQSTVVKYLDKKCPGDHEHAHTEGSVRIDGDTFPMATWCGAYPPQLCRAILRGAEEFLQNRGEEDPVYFNEVFAEEKMMEGDEVVESDEDWTKGMDSSDEESRFKERHTKKPRYDEEVVEAPQPAAEEHQVAPEHTRHPVASKIKKAVEHAHRSLGHPSRQTMVRMLRLAGSSQSAVEYAKIWKCDVCSARAAPKQPTASAPGLRPYGFNKHHQVDLKYCRDHRGKKYVFLSMIDVGTGYHHGVMLKTRKSEYVATKWLKQWVSTFGTPAKLTHDQGGEFEKGFTAMLEDLSLPSVVTGSHAGWQLSFAERHGGLLGLIIGAVVAEHQVEGYSGMKLALAAAIQGKNSTVSREGYTPAQRVFGHELRFPGLTDEDEAASFAESLGTDGEVARAHKMRMTARMALLREDVQDRLRRAVLRKPHRSHDEFPPGCQIYFWSPSKAAKRYVPGTWRGPATVLVKEAANRFFVSWRGRCLLLARENMWHCKIRQRPI